MSKYSTGEMAKLCDVSVRTVQYYDQRGILIPSELSEGGRRLYSDNDLQRLKLICFLRDLDIPINTIGELLAEEKPERVINLLLKQQTEVIENEISERQEKLQILASLQTGIKNLERFSINEINDIAYTVMNKKKLKQVRLTMILSGIPLSLYQWFSIYIWIARGLWWPFLIWVCIAIPYAILISRYYFTHVAYICPNCQTVFKPKFKEAFFARHTPSTRKLTCAACSYHGFCVETYGKEDSINEQDS